MRARWEEDRQKPTRLLGIFALQGWITLLILSCETKPIVVDPDAFKEIYVYCILSPAADQQTVFISRTEYQKPPQPVTDAQVRIIGPAGETVLLHAGDGFYRDDTGALRVEPGGEYRLRITLKDGRQISAATIVPASFSASHFLSGDTLKAKWVHDEVYGYSYLEIYLPEIYLHAAGGWVTWLEGYYERTDGYYNLNRRCMTTRDTLSSDTLYAYAPTDTSVTGYVYSFTRCDTAMTVYAFWHDVGCFWGEVPQRLIDLRPEDWEAINVVGAHGLFGSALRDSLHFAIRVEK
jgi:hypothetical protein